MLSQYQCCFCAQTIRPGGADVGGLHYTTNVDGQVDKQHDQQFWCHAKCLREHFHSSVPLYVLDLVESEGEDV